MVNNHRHSYGESIKNPPRALLLNSIQTTNYALNVRFRSIGPQTPSSPHAGLRHRRSAIDGIMSFHRVKEHPTRLC